MHICTLFFCSKLLYLGKKSEKEVITLNEHLKRKLTSRKLWLSIASFVSMLIISICHNENAASEVSAIIMAGATVIGYVIGEGLADSKPDATCNEVQDKER